MKIFLNRDIWIFSLYYDFYLSNLIILVGPLLIQLENHLKSQVA